MKEFWKEVFSENGNPSSKRVAGMFMIVITCVVVTILAIKNGCSECIKDLLQTIVLSAMALLGISSITSVFKK